VLTVVMLSIVYAECDYFDCHFVECSGALWRNKKRYIIQEFTTDLDPML
jgi:hypothetical protein